MAVDTTTRKVSFIMDAGVTEYDFTFRALTSAPTDIKATRTVIATGVETELDYTTDYTVVINSNGVGGTLTVVDPTTDANKITIYRDTTDLQESDYNDYNQFPADTVETDLDRRTMKSQETAETIGRTLKLPITSTISTLTLPNPSARKALIWNEALTAIINSTYDPDDSPAAAASSATAALASQNAASTSATAALASENAAATSATIAVAAAALASSRATLALDNLASVAINADLIPATTATISLGSATLLMKDIYATKIALGTGTTSATISIAHADADSHGIDVDVTVELASAKYGLRIYSAIDQDAGTALSLFHLAHTSSTIINARFINAGVGHNISVEQMTELASNQHALYVVSAVDQDDSALATINQDSADSSAAALQILQDGSAAQIVCEGNETLSNSGVWTDRTCCHADKIEIRKLEDYSEFASKLRVLDLFEYKKKHEVDMCANPKQREKYENMRANVFKGHILDDPTTPEELISRDYEGKIDGKAAALGVDFLLGVSKDLLKRIEILESK